MVKETILHISSEAIRSASTYIIIINSYRLASLHLTLITIKMTPVQRRWVIFSIIRCNYKKFKNYTLLSAEYKSPVTEASVAKSARLDMDTLKNTLVYWNKLRSNEIDHGDICSIRFIPVMR